MKQQTKKRLMKVISVLGTPAALCVVMTVSSWYGNNIPKFIIWGILSVLTLPLLPFAILYAILTGIFDDY